jgi:hypothetical protein
MRRLIITVLATATLLISGLLVLKAEAATTTGCGKCLYREQHDKVGTMGECKRYPPQELS